MDLNIEMLKLILYATKNKNVCLGRTPNIPTDEKTYILKEYNLKEFVEKEQEYISLSLLVQSENGSEEIHSINNIISMEYDIGENSSNEFKIWFFSVNLEKLDYLSNDCKQERHKTWRIFLYPDMYFLDKTRKSQEIDMNKFMYINPIFRDRDFKIDYDKVFIAMPFKYDEYNLIYNSYIKPILTKMNFEPVRVDEKTTSGDVMECVWKEINESAFVIADVSTANANVLYEIGIAHTLGKEVIILTDCTEEVPFDIRKNRYLNYKTDSEGSIQVMKRTLENVIADIAIKICNGCKENSQVLNIEDIEYLSNELSINKFKIIVKRGNLAILLKKDDDFAKFFMESDRCKVSPYYERNNCMNIYLESDKNANINLNFDIEISNEKYLQALRLISEGQAKFEVYIVSNGLRTISTKRIFDSKNAKIELNRQLLRIPKI